VSNKVIYYFYSVQQNIITQWTINPLKVKLSGVGTSWKHSPTYTVAILG